MDTLKKSEDLSRGLLQNLDNFSYVLQEEHRKMSHPRAHNNLVRIKKKKKSKIQQRISRTFCPDFDIIVLYRV